MFVESQHIDLLFSSIELVFFFVKYLKIHPIHKSYSYAT